MPATPYVVSGTITNASGVLQANAVIKFTTASGSGVAVSNSSGQYLFDLADVGYTAGETVTYVVNDEFANQTLSGSFTVTGDDKTLNCSLSVRSDLVFPPGNRTIVIYNVGGKPVTEDNPFPVSTVGVSYDFDLVNNPATTWTITRGDGQPDSETITINGVSYKRTFTYDASNFLISRSAWVRQ